MYVLEMALLSREASDRPVLIWGLGLVVAALIAVNSIGDVLDEFSRIMGRVEPVPSGMSAGTLELLRLFAHFPQPAGGCHRCGGNQH